jgi:hypothetical protein
MSAKWVRSKAWDDKHLAGWLWPAKAVLRAFSSIPLAVVLLTFVALYAVLASVPIGLIVLGVTYVFYCVTVLVALVGAGVGMGCAAGRGWFGRWSCRLGAGRGAGGGCGCLGVGAVGVAGPAL